MVPYITMSQLTVSENFGSQMGNFAALYAIAKNTGHRIIFLDSWTAGKGLKLLDAFAGLPIEIVSMESLGENGRVVSVFNLDGQVVIDSRVYGLDPLLNYDIRGLFSSYRYWYLSHDVRQEVIQLFEFDENVRRISDESVRRLRFDGRAIVAIHVRRSDYLSSSVHENLSMDYYKKAISMFDCDESNFLVFSDDIEWCKFVFKKYRNIYFSDKNTPYVDMCSMSLCDHNIIANSSFSAWGAFLNKSTAKKIVCPARFVKNDKFIPYLNYSWFPDDWIAL